MPDKYAPALLLDVVAFWFVLRWLLPAELLPLLGRLLILMMAVGTLGTLAQHHYVWATFFGASAAFGWTLLRRWRSKPVRRFSVRLPKCLAWRVRSPDEVAMLCERRIGHKVDAAAPATVRARPLARCVLALAGDGVWVLEDESHLSRPGIGRVVTCWDRKGMVANIEHSRRGECFELSWPRRGALIRGVMPRGAPADQLAGHLIADELAQRP